MSPVQSLLLRASRLAHTKSNLIYSIRQPGPQYQCFIASQLRRRNSSHFLPTILQPRFWRTLWPTARSSQSDDSIAPAKKKGWNPATFFIVIFLLIGSQSIQMIQLKRNSLQFSQETEAKLSLLREVVRRVQNGEDVDVAKELGTGDKAKEKEWEEVMRELEEEDAIIQKIQQKRRAMRAAAEEKAERHGTKDNWSG